MNIQTYRNWLANHDYVYLNIKKIYMTQDFLFPPPEFSTMVLWMG